ncbi:uncharacterized protein LOC106673807 isoform X2 [Cimex lectularius]|uniref:SCP domain-containing protein n=1 Tax=Cimex lectularius TaxID=79782 RepID=A0A8I6SBV4_CIMLE|nr:uncharacterized protein LOC106673807 isoform X2 [Cimex lectularius]
MRMPDLDIPRSRQLFESDDSSAPCLVFVTDDSTVIPELPATCILKIPKSSRSPSGGGGGGNINVGDGMDLTRYRPSLHAHDFTPGGNSRVVMIRKKEQRTFASSKIGQETHFETLTKETVQTFRGNKIERKITSETRGSPTMSSDLLQQLNLHQLNLLNLAEDDLQKKPLASNLIQTNSKITDNVKQTQSPAKPKDKKKVEFTGRFTANFAQECLDAHNEKRAIHKAPPLKLSKEMCKFSQEWADKLAASGRMHHRPNNSYGENLFLSWSSSTQEIHGIDPVENWYAEISDHQFHKEPVSLKTGHFTQVVWLESAKLGVGVAKSQDGKQVYVVCNYDPPGNFIGSFAENVPPIGGFPEKAEQTTGLCQTAKEFNDEMLKLHNEYRARHGSPPLKLNEQMCEKAQDWAETLAKTSKLDSKNDSEYGENLFWTSASRQCAAKDACASWYNEVKHFKYGVEPKALNAGHFTQMVWRETKELGVGRAKGRGGSLFIVAFYKKRGNIVGHFGANVLRP